MAYSEIEHLNSDDRIKRILEVVKENKIVLLEGRLSREEEANLIQATMQQISNKFKGIELGVFENEKGDDVFINKLKKNFVKMLLGNRNGMTIIGPASIVKEIKKNPNKIELLTKESNKKRARKR
ncbi:MAG: DUF2073 domain-containing protein [Candidatus Woesearchaeota archaeon]|jgi:hypothetical protein|nr:DUF2073 domain-containing protein [Candidatus Woesearchaeota archaeon]MDP7506425.1 DUF2073 domain-containing protein [Candidatus Woesearchaeota archaeon]MDP7610697.1 DUF2073 domain-containing protein [Candidatus Woesearchaeota archaeon]|tara:strand:+ start:2269 stop:2643 length:375 start_codon:yes stop_codon:yes gene_type:complete